MVATIERALGKEFLVHRKSLAIHDIFQSVERVDDFTVVFDAGIPNSTLLTWLVNKHTSIVPKHLITGGSTSDDVAVRWHYIHPDDTGTLSVGTGRFKMVGWDPDVHAKWVRFEDYWGTEEFGNPFPYIDRFGIYVVPDGSREYAKFVSGEFLTSDFSSLGVAEAQALCDKASSPGTCATVSHGHGIFWVIMNLGLEPMGAPRIVKAARYTLDAKDGFEVQLGAGTAGGDGTWTNRTLYPDAAISLEGQSVLMPWIDPANRQEYDQMAMDLVAEGGYSDGRELPLPIHGIGSDLFQNV